MYASAKLNSEIIASEFLPMSFHLLDKELSSSLTGFLFMHSEGNIHL